MALDLIGMIPAFGDIADLINAGVYIVVDKDNTSAMYSAGAVLVPLGVSTLAKYSDEVIDATRLLRRLDGATDEAASLLKNLPTGLSDEAADATKAGLDFATHSGDDIAEGAAKGLDDVGVAKKGIYEFPDQATGGKPYVGQSEDIPRRLDQHEAAGRLRRGTETTTDVPGGKTAREVAEHNRIQELTGGQKASHFPAVSNQRDPIGPNRRPGLGIPDPLE